MVNKQDIRMKIVITSVDLTNFCPSSLLLLCIVTDNCIFPHFRFILKMILKALPKRTLFSLTLSATAIVVVYFWHIPNISYLNLSKTEVPTLVEPTITTKTWRSSPDIHHHHQEKVFKTHRDAKRKNNAGIFLSKSMYRKKKVKVPPLPQSLPYAAHLKSVHDIQHALWTTQLYVFLKSLKHSVSPHVNMVFGDSHHLDLVLNWIVAAHLRLNPPLHNIMVLSVDQPLCDFLASKKLQVTCIAVPSESILASTLNTTYEQGIKSRLVVLRVINFWGYDVASYDSDAILLRNPQPLIDSHPNVQVLGGASFIPRAFAEHHGIVRFAVCGGTLIVRSHPSTGTL